MLTLSCFWQFASSGRGITSLSSLKKKIGEPKTSLCMSEKLNCRSWSLTLQEERNVVTRVMRAEETLNAFSLSPCKIQKLYFFNRKWAKPIFKKRQNNYVSFEISTNISLMHWFSLLQILLDSTTAIRVGYKLVAGVIVKRRRLLIRFLAVNPAILLAFFKNEPLDGTPQIMRGLCRFPKNSIFSTEWLRNKLNETAQV